MRGRFIELIRFAFLTFGLVVVSLSCSSDQQDEQGEIQASDQEQQQDQEQSQNEDDQEEIDQNEEGIDENLENQNSEDNINEANAAQFEGDQMVLDQSGGQQGDLQEIIEEMNEGGDQLAVQDEGALQGDQFLGNNVVGEDQGIPSGDGYGENALVGADQQESLDSPPIGSGATNAQGLPEVGSKMSYVVQRGDTLGKIAARIYGDQSKWREIAEFTGVSNFDLIFPGDVVYYQLTEQSMAFATAYENLPRSEVQVQAGDTLSTIAGRVLGSSADWKLIWRQNDGIDNPDQLTVGTVIYYVEPGSLGASLDKSDVEFAVDISLDSTNFQMTQSRKTDHNEFETKSTRKMLEEKFVG